MTSSETEKPNPADTTRPAKSPTEPTRRSAEIEAADREMLENLAKAAREAPPKR